MKPMTKKLAAMTTPPMTRVPCVPCGRGKTGLVASWPWRSARRRPRRGTRPEASLSKEPRGIVQRKIDARCLLRGHEVEGEPGPTGVRRSKGIEKRGAI